MNPANLDALEALYEECEFRVVLSAVSEKHFYQIRAARHVFEQKMWTAAPDLLKAARREQMMREGLVELVRIDDEDAIGLQCASGSDLVLALAAAREALKGTP